MDVNCTLHTVAVFTKCHWISNAKIDFLDEKKQQPMNRSMFMQWYMLFGKKMIMFTLVVLKKTYKNKFKSICKTTMMIWRCFKQKNWGEMNKKIETHSNDVENE